MKPIPPKIVQRIEEIRKQAQMRPPKKPTTPKLPGYKLKATPPMLASKPSAAPRKAEFDAAALVSTMRDSVEQMGGVDYDFDFDALDGRLAICQMCRHLAADGCMNCPSCASRWVGWRKRLIAGNCDKFGKFSTVTPTRKVNGMFVYAYHVRYVLDPADPKTKILRNVIAPDLKSAIEATEKAVPGAIVTGAPQGQPVDAVAASVVPAEVEVSPTPAPQPRAPGPSVPLVMGPHGPMMMAAPPE